MRLIYMKPELDNLSQGSRIAFARQFRFMTQDDVSDKLGFTGECKRRTMTCYEKGNRNQKEHISFNREKIEKALPMEMEKGEDLVTLITYTPYGINTHRLLVRGYRIQDNKEFTGWSLNRYKLNTFIQAALMSIIPLIIFISIIIVKNKRFKKMRLGTVNR